MFFPINHKILIYDMPLHDFIILAYHKKKEVELSAWMSTFLATFYFMNDSNRGAKKDTNIFVWDDLFDFDLLFAYICKFNIFYAV